MGTRMRGIRGRTSYETPKPMEGVMCIIRKTGMAGCALLAAAAMTVPVHAAEFLDGRVNANFKLRTGFQSLNADQGAFSLANTDASAGFQRQAFGLELTVHFNDWITGFIDLAEEPEDFGTGAPFQISNDLSFVDFSLLKAISSPLAGNNSLVLRVGEMVTTTFNYRGYSDGAGVQDNPLIGNSPFDLVTAETGVQLIGEHKFTGPLKSLGWDIAATVPTFDQDFSPDRGFVLFGKVRADVGAGFKLGAGFLGTSKGEDQFNKNAVAGSFGLTAQDGSQLSTSEVFFGDGEPYFFPGPGAKGRQTHAGLIPGVDASAWMIDVQYEPTFIPVPTLFRGWYGQVKDDFRFIDGTGAQTVRLVSGTVARGDSEVRGFGVEGTAHLIPKKFYVAARYTQVENKSDGISGTPGLDRIQVGAGWWVHPSTLLKLEYVRQNEDKGSAGQIGSDWDGGLLEVSFKF